MDVINTCPECGHDDVIQPADEEEWFCFTCEHRWLAEPIPAQ